VAAPPGSAGIVSVRVHYATQLDTRPDVPCDFETLEARTTSLPHEYEARLPIGSLPHCGGPAVTAENALVYASVQDAAGYSISSKVYHQRRQMSFPTDFRPIIEHFPRDSFPVQPAPASCP
jgi:hypothetical protein